ncbi:MAG: HlyD family type I secretion periplasmic adaptor subunit [Methylococcaceae bacterium]|jgi:epimerase transport system membrane fusion protein
MNQPSMPTAPLTDDRTLRKLGIFLVLGIFGGLGGWAALAPLNSAADAPGQVTVENYRKTVQHLEGGIVESILVKDGDWVEKGQVLLTLGDTQLRAQLEVLRGQYLITLAREARLVALRDDQTDLVFPADLLKAKNDSRAAEAMRIQSQTFHVRRLAHENEIRLYQEQIGQLRAKERGLQSQKASRDLLVKSYENELHDFQKLLQEGYSEKQTVRELERKYADSVGQSGELQSSLAAAALQISETQLKVLQLKKDLQREVVKELSEVQGEIFELREKIHALEQTVERCIIKAPEAGKVLGLTIHTLGGVIAPGSPILEIVPQNEKLLVEARITPLDIDRVKIGQSAEIRFSVFKSKALPRIEGTLIALSADSLIDESPEHAQYYLARVEVNAEGLDILAKQHLELLPGMPAEVLVNTGKRTLFQYLADPLSDSFSRSFIED